MSASPDDPAGGTPRLPALVRAYQGAATLLLNLLVLLVAVNLLLGAAFALKDRRARRAPAPAVPFAADGAPLPGPKRTTFQLDWFDARAYGPPASDERAARVLDDFHDLAAAGFAYQPWTEFAEPRFEGALVHVDRDERGFLRRRTLAPSGPDGPTVRVFVLGGSTTFGYNVADDETWPSALADALARRASAAGVRVEVANYGRGYYNPSQEAVLLLDLFKSGHRPDLVVLMDGVNWGPAEDVPQFTKRLAAGFHEMQAGRPRAFDGLDGLPLVRLARSLGRRGAPAAEPASAERRDTAQVVERFRASWRVAAALCELYGSDHRFFLQPDPVFNYRAALYRRALPASFTAERAQRADFYARLAGQEQAADLTGLFAAWGDDRKAIVDDVHYSPAFNRFLADEVARRIDLAALVRARPRGAVTPTGEPRAVYPVAP
jgi:GDSL-like lipase/acylhydrolase family protein